ncbi:EAL domain-containing protein [Croceibacterium ferulae]|uniref:EAL domain-containing protein n=1 Tax=Croceibacterium ferulae TaxID=1854641 RepID=UPI000EAE9BFF|nr:EAL domain-containing protein [Croceibacterium ferulae]
MGCEGCKDWAAFGVAIRAAFQPIVDLESGDVFAYEALVRGPDGQGAGWVLDQVDDANRYTFDQACRVVAIRDAVAAGLLETEAMLSINFLPNAVYSPQACIRLTLATAREQNLPTSRLMFEFTEGERLDAAHVRNIVESYRSYGFITAIDDFGAGHAGLGLLADIQTDFLKLDMALVRGVESSQPRRLIVAAMVRLARAMNIRVIAEGIESVAELEELRRLGVRYVQGYLLGRPALGALPVPDPDLLQRSHAA